MRIVQCNSATNNALASAAEDAVLTQRPTAPGFESRIAAMEDFYRAHGLPNDFFPFVAAIFAVCPELNTLQENPHMFDLVSVLQGARSVALVPVCDISSEGPFDTYVIGRLHAKGFAIRESFDAQDLIVGVSERVEQVWSILASRPDEGELSTEYHRVLGEALGYSPASIAHFIERIRY